MQTFGGAIKATGNSSPVTISAQGNIYTGTATINMDIGDGETMKMKSSYSGKRLGNC